MKREPTQAEIQAFLGRDLTQRERDALTRANVRKGNLEGVRPTRAHRDRTKYDRASDKRREAWPPLTDPKVDE